MNFVFIVTALLLAFASSDGKLPLAKMENVLFEEKNRDKYVCRSQMISLLSLYKVVEPCKYIYHNI